MVAETLARVSAAMGSETAERAGAFFREVFDQLPWAVSLTPEEVLTMVAELRQLSLDYQRTQDPGKLNEALEDWKATAEAHADPQFQAAISDPDRRFVPWTR